MKSKKKNDPPPSAFCEVCRLNHNQGRKHRYFRNHAKSLAAVLSRFQSNLSALRLSLRNPSTLSPSDRASRSDRLWCIFCSVDLVNDSPDGAISFAWENVIRHLASSEHLRKLKDFLWTHGGGMEKVDSFRVSEAALLKWEKKCEALKSGSQSSNKGLGGSLQSASKDIQYQIKSNCTNILDTNTVHCFEPTISCGVMPLQRLTTNEGCMPSYSEDARIALGSSMPYVSSSSSMGAMQQDLGVKGTGSSAIIEQKIASSSNGQAASRYSNYGMDQRMVSKKEWRKGIQSSSYFEGSSPQSKIHAEDPTACNAMASSTCSASAFSQSRKLPVLNPKRVGAAWSERRRRELEMEMRGETVISYDPNWLPNFGGVWQGGTRKESRKDFEVEKQKFIKISKQPETSVKIQPYISKRMRTCSNDDGNSSNGYIH